MSNALGALSAMQERGLPRYKEEDYQRFNIEELLGTEYPLHVAPVTEAERAS